MSFEKIIEGSWDDREIAVLRHEAEWWEDEANEGWYPAWDPGACVYVDVSPGSVSIDIEFYTEVDLDALDRFMYGVLRGEGPYDQEDDE